MRSDRRWGRLGPSSTRAHSDLRECGAPQHRRWSSQPLLSTSLPESTELFLLWLVEIKDKSEDRHMELKQRPRLGDSFYQIPWIEQVLLHPAFNSRTRLHELRLQILEWRVIAPLLAPPLSTWVPQGSSPDPTSGPLKALKKPNTWTPTSLPLSSPHPHLLLNQNPEWVGQGGGRC